MYRWREETVRPVRPEPVRQTLTEREREILLFEASWRPTGRRKSDVVLERFGLRPTTYSTVLRLILEKPEAEVVSPALVRRLRHRRPPLEVTRSA